MGRKPKLTGNDDLPFDADGTTFQRTSRLHVSPSNAIQGEEALKRDGERGGNTTWHKVWWHHQQKNRRRSRGAEWGTPIDSYVHISNVQKVSSAQDSISYFST